MSRTGRSGSWAEPEAVEQRTDPGGLTGDIELRDVHFR